MREGGRVYLLRLVGDEKGAIPAPGNEQEAREVGVVENTIERCVSFTCRVDFNTLDITRAESSLIDVAHARRQRDVGHAREVEGVGSYGSEDVVGTLVGDGFGEGEASDASFAGVAFVGPFDFAAFGGFAQGDGVGQARRYTFDITSAQNDGRSNADELDA